MGHDLDKELWDRNDVAGYLNIRPGTVYDWAAKGYLPCIRFGFGKKKKRVRFKQAEIDEWLEKQISEGRTTRIPKKFLEAK